jgi:hypothetical protein
MRLLAPLALCLIPVTQAGATEFRCYPPDPAGYFNAVQASPDQYRIVVGAFDFDPTLMPYGGGAVLLPNIRPIPAHFSGQSFGPDGPGAAVAFDLTILPSCIMVTCASMTPGIQVLAFIRQAPNGPELDADPCGTPLFAPLAETYTTLVECLRDTVCN